MKPCFKCRSPAACRRADACRRPAADDPAPDPDPIDPVNLSREVRIAMATAGRVKGETEQAIRHVEDRLATVERRLRDVERLLVV